MPLQAIIRQPLLIVCSRHVGFLRALVEFARLNLPARNLLWWMQREKSSLLLFRIDPFSAFKMYSFSLLHKLHCFPPDLYDGTCFTMSHLMLYSLFFSFKDHTYFDSSVLVAYKGLAMDFL